MQWRDGVHVTGTPVWCDARRARDVCFVSHAYAAESLRHGQLIATRTTLALIARASRRSQPESQLAVPYARPFTLGSLRFELFASGHAAGAAALSIEGGERRVVYAGAVNPHGGGLGGPADARPCDVLIIDAHYGHPRFSFPDVADARRDTLAFADATSIIVVTSPTKGADVAAALADAGRPVRAHRAIHHAGQRLRADGWTLPPMRRWDGRVRDGEVLLWLDGVALPDRGSARVALVSGDAVDDDRVRAVEADAGFAWSNRADYGELVAYARASGATELFVTGRHAEAFAHAMDGHALGPVRQLQLF